MTEKEKREKAELCAKSCITQLCQLLTVTWDGDLVSKNHRGILVRAGFADRHDGYNFITKKGIALLIKLEGLRA